MRYYYITLNLQTRGGVKKAKILQTKDFKIHQVRLFRFTTKNAM